MSLGIRILINKSFYIHRFRCTLPNYYCLPQWQMKALGPGNGKKAEAETANSLWKSGFIRRAESDWPAPRDKLQPTPAKPRTRPPVEKRQMVVRSSLKWAGKTTTNWPRQRGARRRVPRTALAGSTEGCVCIKLLKVLTKCCNIHTLPNMVQT